MVEMVLVLVMQVARDPKAMGGQPIGPTLAALGWITTGAMFIALLGLAYGAFAR